MLFALAMSIAVLPAHYLLAPPYNFTNNIIALSAAIMIIVCRTSALRIQPQWMT